MESILKQMPNADRPINVLLIDQGLSFGGAINILISLSKNLPDAFTSRIVTAIDDDIAKWTYTYQNTPIVSCKPAYTYVDHFKTQSCAQEIKNSVLRRLYIYWASLTGFASNLVYVYKIWRLIQKHDIDIVHVNASVLAALATAISGRACIWHFHGAPGKRTLLRRILDRWISYYLCISDFVSDTALKRGYPAEKLITIHNPVSDHMFAPDRARNDDRAAVRAQLGVSQEEVLIAIFGRIVRWKGQLELVKAITHIKATPGIRVMLVGDSSEGFGDDYKRQIQVLIESHNIQHQFIWTGFVKDVHRYYQAADLVVHTSTDPEPFGLVVIEAMAAGRPIIASTRGAPSELIIEGQDGYLVNPTDTELLANRILLLVNSPELRKTLAEAAKAKIQAQFLPHDYAVKVSKLYEAALTASNRSNISARNSL